MTIEDFKLKWSGDINKGIVKVKSNPTHIIADRWNGREFLCDRNHINKIHADIRRMGYLRLTTGVYALDFSDDSLMAMSQHVEELLKSNK